MNHLGDYDVIVIGAGHAGIEAAHAAATLGARTAVFTMSLDAIGNMPCNPSIGGTAKGTLVRELDALGGVMGLAADATYLQSRMLNKGKGPAVHALRVQTDRKRYHEYMKHALELTPGLAIHQAEVVGLEVENGRVKGIVTQLNGEYTAKCVVLATGTNLGSIRFVHGGVARNVAEDMARIGSPVTFVTLGDTTPMSREAMERLEAQKIDLRYSIRVPQNGVGLWLAVMDEKGDLAGSTSQMPDTEPLARYLQERGEEIVSGADSVCLEMDMGEELSEWIVALCQKYRKDLYCISANMSVVQRRPDLLRHTRCFICNDIEAERLLHHPVSRADPEAAVETILHYGRGMGLRSMVVTLGSAGSVYYDSITGDAGHCPAHRVEMVDSTGAGDAFFSGVVSGLTRGLSLGRAVSAGTRLAALTIQSDEACCPSLPDFWEEMRP